MCNLSEPQPAALACSLEQRILQSTVVQWRRAAVCVCIATLSFCRGECFSERQDARGPETKLHLARQGLRGSCGGQSVLVRRTLVLDARSTGVSGQFAGGRVPVFFAQRGHDGPCIGSLVPPFECGKRR